MKAPSSPHDIPCSSPCRFAKQRRPHEVRPHTHPHVRTNLMRPQQPHGASFESGSAAPSIALFTLLGALGVREATTFSGRPPPLPDSHSREGTGSTGRRRIARKRTAALPSRAIARPAAKRRTTAIGPAAGCRMAVVQLRAATSGSVPSGAAATDSPAAGCCRGSLAAGYYQRVRPLVPPQATVQLRAAVGRRFSCGLPSVVQLRAATSGTGASRHTSTGQLRADRRRALAMVRQVLGRPVYRRQWRQSPP